MSGDRVLIVEDEETIRWSVAERLRADGVDVEEAETGAAALEKVAAGSFDLMLLDLKLPDTDGLAVLRRGLEIEPDLSVIIITAHGTVASAVEAMRLGAFDYRTKPFALEDLVVAVGKALETARLRREVRFHRDQFRASVEAGKLVFASPAMRSILNLVSKLGGNDLTTVLLLGESGTGKGAIAGAIHAASGRTDRPMVSINCTAIPETLLESELFGHERGAFTDARQMKRGLLDQAHGGTVFLDEIGDMPLPLQAKLLQFLEERRFRRVGGMVDLHVDARVIAATNCDLDRAVAEGRFRTDLYYRLKVVPIQIPPLRNRIEDIPPLAAHFIEGFARDFKKQVSDIEPGALEALLKHPWPGNVRELRNAIERAVLFCEGGRITSRDLLLEPSARLHGAGHGPGMAAGQILLTRAGIDLRTVERNLVRQALEMASCNYAEAARLLGLTREQVKYRAEKFHLTPAAHLGGQGIPHSTG